MGMTISAVAPSPLPNLAQTLSLDNILKSLSDNGVFRVAELTDKTTPLVQALIDWANKPTLDRFPPRERAVLQNLAWSLSAALKNAAKSCPGLADLPGFNELPITPRGGTPGSPMEILAMYPNILARVDLGKTPAPAAGAPLSAGAAAKFAVPVPVAAPVLAAQRTLNWDDTIRSIGIGSGLGTLSATGFASLVTFARAVLNKPGSYPAAVLSLVLTLTAKLKAEAASGAVTKFLLDRGVTPQNQAEDWLKVIDALPDTSKQAVVKDPNALRDIVAANPSAFKGQPIRVVEATKPIRVNELPIPPLPGMESSGPPVALDSIAHAVPPQAVSTSELLMRQQPPVDEQAALAWQAAPAARPSAGIDLSNAHAKRHLAIPTPEFLKREQQHLDPQAVSVFAGAPPFVPPLRDVAPPVLDDHHLQRVLAESGLPSTPIESGLPSVQTPEQREPLPASPSYFNELLDNPKAWQELEVRHAEKVQEQKERVALLRANYQAIQDKFQELGIAWPLQDPVSVEKMDKRELGDLLAQAYRRLESEYRDNLHIEPPFELPKDESDPEAWATILAQVSPPSEWESLLQGSEKPPKDYSLAPAAGDTYHRAFVKGLGEIVILSSTANRKLAVTLPLEHFVLETLDANITECNRTVQDINERSGLLRDVLVGVEPPSAEPLLAGLGEAKRALLQGDLPKYYRETIKLQRALNDFGRQMKAFGKAADKALKKIDDTAEILHEVVLLASVAVTVATEGAAIPVVRSAMSATSVAITAIAEGLKYEITGEFDIARVGVSALATYAGIKGGPVISKFLQRPVISNVLRRLCHIPGAGNFSASVLNAVATNLVMGAGLRGGVSVEATVETVLAEAKQGKPATVGRVVDIAGRKFFDAVFDGKGAAIDILTALTVSLGVEGAKQLREARATWALRKAMVLHKPEGMIPPGGTKPRSSGPAALRGINPKDLEMLGLPKDKMPTREDARRALRATYGRGENSHADQHHQRPEAEKAAADANQKKINSAYNRIIEAIDAGNKRHAGPGPSAGGTPPDAAAPPAPQPKQPPAPPHAPDPQPVPAPAQPAGPAPPVPVVGGGGPLIPAAPPPASARPKVDKDNDGNPSIAEIRRQALMALGGQPSPAPTPGPTPGASLTSAGNPPAADAPPPVNDPNGQSDIAQGDVAAVLAALRESAAAPLGPQLSTAELKSLSKLADHVKEYGSGISATIIADGAFLSQAERAHFVDNADHLSTEGLQQISEFLNGLPRSYGDEIKARFIECVVWLGPQERPKIMRIITTLAEHENSGRVSARHNEGVESLTPQERAKIREDMRELFQMTISGKVPARFIEFAVVPAQSSPVDEVTTILKSRAVDAMRARNGADLGADAIRRLINERANAARGKNQPATLRILIATGFTVGEQDGKPLPETDGPPGAGILGHDLQKLSRGLAAKGKNVKIEIVYVTDPTNAPVQRAVNKALGVGAKIHVFDAPHGAEAGRAAGNLLDRIKPDVVLFTERPGRNDDGQYLNMRGVSVKPLNPPLDAVLHAADEPARHIKTIAIGDGGNEAGMGGVNLYMPQNVLKLSAPTEAAGGSAASIYAGNGAGHTVTASVSNWGAQALGGALMRDFGMLGAMHTPGQVGLAITAAGGAGAVDGVTRLKPGEVDKDGLVAGVDGLSTEAHIGEDALLKASLADPSKVSTPPPVKPVGIILFDSSNGALIAAKTIAARILQQTGRPVQFIILADHGNAPYGSKTGQEITTLTNQALKTAKNIAAKMGDLDTTAMVCNTACTPGMENYARGISMPVVDLVEMTSRSIVTSGGEKPIIVATQATIDSKAYPNQVQRLAGKKITDDQTLAAPDWATIVNKLQHESRDPKVESMVTASIRAIVDKIPPDATSLWLNCTHYPVLEPLIRQQLNVRAAELVARADVLEVQGHRQEANNLRNDAGRLQALPIVDPMKIQADAIISGMQMDVLPPDQRGAAGAQDTPPPLIVTTGDPRQVYPSARALMDRPDARVVNVKQFGEDTDVSDIPDHYAAPEPANWRTALVATRRLHDNQSRQSDPSARARVDSLLRKAIQPDDLAAQMAAKAAKTTTAGAASAAVAVSYIVGGMLVPGAALDIANAAAFTISGLTNFPKIYFLERLRKQSATIFVDGNVTREAIDRYVRRIESAAPYMRFSQPQLAKIVDAAERFWADYQNLNNRPLDAATGWNDVQKTKVIRARIATFQSEVGGALGVPDASSISPLDPRMPLGQATDIATLATLMVSDAAFASKLAHGGFNRSSAATIAASLLLGTANAIYTVNAGAKVVAARMNVNLNGGNLLGGAQVAARGMTTTVGLLWTGKDTMELMGYIDAAIARRSFGGVEGVMMSLDEVAKAACDAAITYAVAHMTRDELNKVLANPTRPPEKINRALMLYFAMLAIREAIAIVELALNKKPEKKSEQGAGSLH